MNTEKLEKLKKSLDNKFIPDNMKDKIRAEIKKLEADIKTDETITATEVKEEVKEIEKKVEKALEVAEEKEEQAEAKAEEKKEKAPRKAREKKATESKTKTPKVEPKSTAKKKSVFSIAKEIRKDNESWEDAKLRARKMMKSETTEIKKKTRTETDKLLAMVRRNKEYKKLAGTSNLSKDASRRALPRGKRVSADGNVYYENRANRVDVGGFKNAYLENGGGFDGIIELKPLELIPLSTQLNKLSGYNWTSGDWESEDGGKPSTMPNSVIVNVHTKQKIRLSPFYVYKGIDHYNSKPLYRVEDMSEEGEYVGEWYTNREDAVQELKEMFGSYDNGGKLKKSGRYSILGEVDGEQPILYATTDDKERIKPLVNMAEIDLHELTGKKHRIFVTDEVTDDEVYNYGKGGRTRERKYVNHSQDYEVRYSKDKPNRRGYGYENGGSIEDEKFKKFINSQVSYIISLKTISQKREPIQNLLNNMEDYRSGSEIVKRITTDNLKYALQQKTASKMNEVLRISLNALQYADGGTIIGTPETPLGRDLGIDYTGLVGETDAMSSGEMFAEGGSLDNHGLKHGDQIIKTMSGGVQKVKTKTGDIVYINLANGYRGAEPPIPFAKGGVTKNYIQRKQLNTITIKKGDKKLTYKVSDVYNGAYKLEDGGKLEKSAFYVPKRNVVKVQLKTGKDVKVANGYWIKKGAKPIRTSKYDDGGEMEYEGGGKTTFKQKATAIAKNFEGKKVEPKYQKEYGKTYDKAEAKEVGNKIAGSQKAKYDSKMSGGGKTKRGGAMQLAKQIRKDGESWQSALKRANEQVRNK